MPVIRRADLRDAAQLARLAEATFRDTFAAMNSAGDMDLHCGKHYGEAIQAAEIADPKRVTFVGQEANRLVCYAQLRWNAAPACVAAGRPGEIQRLYVAADWRGKGLAQQLMAECLEEIGAHGSDVAWLGVWERNARAIAFYRKFGFVEVGEHTFPVGNDPQRDIVMARPLDGAHHRQA